MTAALLVLAFAVVIACIEPWLIPICIVLILPSDPTTSLSVTDLTWSKIFIVIGLFRFTYDLVTSHALRERFLLFLRSAGFVWVALILWAAVTVLWAPSKGIALKDVAKLFEYFLALILGLAFLNGRRKVVTYTLLLWGALLALPSVGQLLHGGATNALTGETLLHRASSIFEGPNQASGYFEVLFSIALAHVLASPDLRERLRHILALLGPSVGVILTGSRGGVASIAAASVAGIAFAARSKRMVIVGTVIAAGILFLFALLQPARLESGVHIAGEVSATQRAALWDTAIRMARSRPLTGVGAGNFPVAYPRYADHGYSFYLRTHANNLYLNEVAELGIPGLLLMLAFFALCLRAAIGRMKVAGERVEALTLIALIVGLCVHGLVDDLLVYPVVAIPAFIVLGETLIHVKNEEVKMTNLFARRMHAPVIAALMILTPIAAFGLSQIAALAAAGGYPGLAVPFAVAATYLAPYDTAFQAAAGEMKLHAGHFDSAAAQLDNLAGRDPHAQLLAGEAWQALGVGEKARADWNAGISRICSAHMDGWRYVEMETYAVQRGLYRSGLYCMQRAIVNDPLQPVSLEHAAAIANILGQPSLAADYATRGLELQPHSVPLRSDLIDALLKQGRRSEATVQIASLSASDQGIELARLGISWHNVGDDVRAKALLDKSERQHRLTDEAAFVRGLIAQNEHDSATANRFFARSGASAYALTRAQTLLASGDYVGAAPLLEVAAKYDRNAASAEQLGQVLLYKLNRPKAAIPWFGRALSDGVATREAKARLYGALGDGFLLAGDIRRAASYYVQSTSTFPTSEMYLHLATTDAQLFRPRAADEAFKKAIQLGPRDGTNYAAYVEFLRRQHRMKESRVWLQKGLVMAPNDPRLLQLNRSF